MSSRCDVVVFRWAFAGGLLRVCGLRFGFEWSRRAQKSPKISEGVQVEEGSVLFQHMGCYVQRCWIGVAILARVPLEVDVGRMPALRVSG